MTNPFTLVKTAVRAAMLIRNPSRLGDVIDIADNLSSPAMVQAFVDEVSRDPQGARALRERPRVSLDLEQLGKLPEGSLGRAFADHMIANGLDPAALPTRPARDAGHFVLAHLFETHDLWHVVTGFDTDVAGELGLQAFYLAQVPSHLAPLLLAGGLVNTLVYAYDQRTVRMDSISRGWELGRRARPLFGLRWNDLLALPLAEVRERLGIPGPVSVAMAA
jgi:ubiquinone biosynthesis protein COQ4